MAEKQGRDDFQSIGEFRIGDDLLFGELKLDGPNTSLRLMHREYFHLDKISNRQTLGELWDGTKVSLIDCNLPPIPDRGPKGFLANIFPHLTVLGRSHFDVAKAKVAVVHWQLPDLHKVFYDFDAFGSSLEPKQFISEIVAEMERFTGRKIAVGNNPVVQYFTGNNSVITCATDWGEFEIRHVIGQSFGGPAGVSLNNKMWANLRFDPPILLNEAILRANRLSHFIGLVVGRPQNTEEWRIETDEGPEGDSLKVIPSLPERHEWDSGQINPGPSDMLLDGLHRQEEFSSVLRHWVATHAELTMARNRLWDSFKKQNYFDADRIIAAANLFDTIPDKFFPGGPELGDDLRSAIQNAEELFKPLTPSTEQETILRELRRVKRHTLRTKVKHWAKDIIDQKYGAYQELSFVIDRAVKCRNFFVHGGEAEFDYESELGLLAFLVRTFEFCYVVPEFLRAGWSTKLHGQIHPFGEYAFGYDQNLKKLKSRL